MTRHIFAIFCIAALMMSCTKSTEERSASAAATPDTATLAAKSKPQQVTIAMVGDIMMGNTWPADRLPEADGKHLFDDVAPILQKADVACGNLEGVIAPPEMGMPRKNPESKHAFMFKMPPRYVSLLKDAGFHFLGLSNNHIYDFYGDPIVFTEKALSEANIGFAGAKNPSKANGKHTFAAYKTIGGVTYGFASFGTEVYNACFLDYSFVKNILKEVRKKADVVIVYFHGGAEGSAARHLPVGTEHFLGCNRGDLRTFTHLCIDNGADVVFGSGPHVARAIELYKQHFIAYSLGNFCTCGMGIAGLTGLAPLITIAIDPADGKFKSGKIHAFRQKYMAGPKTDKSGEVISEIRSLTLSDIKNSALDIAADGTISIKNSTRQ